MTLIGLLGGAVIGFLVGLIGWIGFDLPILTALAIYICTSICIATLGVCVALRSGDRTPAAAPADMKTA